MEKINLLDETVMNYDKTENIKLDKLEIKKFEFSSNITTLSYTFTRPVDNSIFKNSNQTKQIKKNLTLNLSFNDLQQSNDKSKDNNKIAVAITTPEHKKTTNNLVFVSDVVIIKIKNNSTKKLNITFHQIVNYNKNKGILTCCSLNSIFLNFFTNIGANLNWETTYCQVLNEKKIDFDTYNLTCSCNHTTSYAALFNPFEEQDELKLTNYYNVEISLFLVVISIISLILCLIIFISYK